MSVKCYSCDLDFELDLIKIDNKHEYCIDCYENIFNEHKLRKPYMGNQDQFKNLLNIIEALVQDVHSLKFKHEQLQNFIRKINK